VSRATWNALPVARPLPVVAATLVTWPCVLAEPLAVAPPIRRLGRRPRDPLDIRTIRPRLSLSGAV